MIAWIKSYVFQILLAFALLAIGYLGVKLVVAQYSLAKATVAAEGARRNLADYKEETQRKTAELTDKNRMLEQKLGTQFLAFTKDKSDALQALTAEHAAAIAGLRDRPARPAAQPPGAVGPAPGSAAAVAFCGREMLYRDDAEVVIGLANAAAELRIELLDVRARYAAGQAALKQSGEVK